MINYKAIIRVIGNLLLLETMMLLLSSGVSAYYQDDALKSLLVTASLTGAIGLLMSFLFRKSPNVFTRRDGYIIVTA